MLVAALSGCSQPSLDDSAVHAPRQGAEPTLQAGPGPAGPAAAPDAGSAQAPVIEATTTASTEMRDSYQQCLDKADGVTPDIQDCIGDEYDHQDRRLNAAYEGLLKTLDAAAQTRLRDAQRKWVAERDAECAPEDDPGQGQLLEANGCSLRLTAARADELEKMLAAATGNG